MFLLEELNEKSGLKPEIDFYFDHNVESKIKEGFLHFTSYKYQAIRRFFTYPKKGNFYENIAKTTFLLNLCQLILHLTLSKRLKQGPQKVSLLRKVSN